MNRWCVFCLLIIVAAFTLDVKADWEQTNGPYSSDIRSLCVKGSTIYAATYSSGIFCSSNNGESWIRLNDRIKINEQITRFNDITSIAVQENNLFVGTRTQGLFVSADSGATWVQIKSPPVTILDSLFADMQMPPESPVLSVGKYLLAVFADGYLYRTKDNGVIWEQMPSPWWWDWEGLFCFKKNRSDLFLGMKSGVFWSSDTGATWVQVVTSNQGQFINKRALSVTANERFLFVGTDNGVYASGKNSDTWDSAGLSTLKVSLLEELENCIFAGTNEGLYRSCDNGTTWEFVNSGITETIPDFDRIPSEVVYGDKFIANGKTLFIATLNALFKSTDNGTTWECGINGPGLKNRSISSIYSSENAIFAIGEDSRYPLFRSVDNGFSWVPVMDGVNHICSNGDIVYAKSGCIYRNTENGESWSKLLINNLDTKLWYLKTIACNKSGVLALVHNGNQVASCFSSDSGTNWTQLNDIASGIAGGNDLISVIANESTFFMSTHLGIFRSTDEGKNWTRLDTLLPKKALITACGNHIFAGKVGVFAGEIGSTHIYRSSDNGNTWKASKSYLRGLLSLLVKDDFLFALADSGVLLSVDEGETWKTVNAGLPLNFVKWRYNHLTANGNYLFVGTYDSSVWRHTLSGFNSAIAKPLQQSSNTYITFKVVSSGNLHSKVEIAFTLPRHKNVNVTIYKLSGHVVWSLGNRWYEAGSYTVSWDAQKMSAGYYLIQMQAGKKIFVKRIILTR